MFSKTVQARSSVLNCGTMPMPRRRKGRSLHDIDAGDVDVARSGEHAGGADADGSGFAGAVRAEQTVYFTLFDGEIDPVDCGYALFAFVDLAKAFNLYDCRHDSSPCKKRLLCPPIIGMACTKHHTEKWETQQGIVEIGAT